MKERVKSPYCTNCGKILQKEDNYCPNCGQENDIKRQSFGKVMSELIIGFLSIESRLAHSIPALLFKPAFLTKEYLKGRRQRYLDPVRMFLTIVVIYFLVGSMTGEDKNDEGSVNMIDSAGHFATDLGDTITVLQKGPLKLNFSPPDLSDSLESEDDTLSLDVDNYNKIKQLLKAGISNDLIIMDSIKVENTFWNRFYYHEVIKFAKTDYNELKNYFISKLPWIIFCLIPVFALLLKLIYYRRKFLYIDHLIFSFHLFSFYFLSGLLVNLFEYLFNYDVTAWFTLAVIIYTIVALKNYYGQGILKTLLKLFLLFLIYFFTTIVCLAFITFVMFLLY